MLISKLLHYICTLPNGVIINHLKLYKKNIMKVIKRLLACVTALVLLGWAAVAVAGSDKVISVDELPQAAQQLLKTEFSGKEVALAKMEKEVAGKSYEVAFSDGGKVEFDKNGTWTEIKCRQGAVPQSLIPEKISEYVSQNYKGQTITEIEKENKGYEIKLSNGLEITFNSKYKVTDID